MQRVERIVLAVLIAAILIVCIVTLRMALVMGAGETSGFEGAALIQSGMGGAM